jgi:hypothetical protein
MNPHPRYKIIVVEGDIGRLKLGKSLDVVEVGEPGLTEDQFILELDTGDDWPRLDFIRKAMIALMGAGMLRYEEAWGHAQNAWDAKPEDC